MSTYARIVTAAAAALLLAVALIVVTVASSAPTANGQINVTATLTAHSSANLRPGRRVADVQWQRWRLTDRHGRTVGRMYLWCAWIVSQIRVCTTEVVMPQGKITAAGSSPTVFEGEYAVTGGTGRYRGGGGVLLYQAIGLRKAVLRVEVTT